MNRWTRRVSGQFTSVPRACEDEPIPIIDLPIPVAAKIAAMPAAVDDRSMARPGAVSLIAT
jgi:hypothetical protein